jgi:hypothetical protein
MNLVATVKPTLIEGENTDGVAKLNSRFTDLLDVGHHSLPCLALHLNVVDGS